MKTRITCLLILICSACMLLPPDESSAPVISAFPMAVPPTPEPAAWVDTLPVPPTVDYDTALWTELIRLDSSFVIDLRYATDNNFVDTVMYACGRCFLRPVVARALWSVHRDLQAAGYRLMLLDCYRPRPVQWRLWRKVPDPRFVSDPNKGSMHNRGAAVDLTLADIEGNELDMGTPFDFFGPEAYPAYTQLADSILQRRQLLRDAMTSHGFHAIRTEWWHFAFSGHGSALAEWEWACP